MEFFISKEQKYDATRVRIEKIIENILSNFQVVKKEQ